MNIFNIYRGGAREGDVHRLARRPLEGRPRTGVADEAAQGALPGKGLS